MTRDGDDEQLELETLRARKLPVYVELDCSVEDERTLRGWITCPAQGQVDLDQCTACQHCRGVLVETLIGAPKVLCAWREHDTGTDHLRVV